MNTNKTQAEQLPQDAVMRCYFPNFKILRKENFYTKEPVEILRIAFLGKVWFYHLTFRRFL